MGTSIYSIRENLHLTLLNYPQVYLGILKAIQLAVQTLRQLG